MIFFISSEHISRPETDPTLMDFVAEYNNDVTEEFPLGNYHITLLTFILWHNI